MPIYIEKRKLLDDLEQEKTSLETDLENHEARLVELHKDHVDRAQVTCQGKKKQKLDLAQKLERKLHAIQRMQRMQEYAQLQVQLNPLIEALDAEIQNLEALVRLQQRSAAESLRSPAMVGAIAAAELPSMD